MISQENNNLQRYVENIQPLFIGLNDNAIYACHHVAEKSTETQQVVVICPPLGHEYERCHRALKQFASMLTKVGIDVLRFDYRGTGDSAGEYHQHSFASWQQDIHQAIDFIKQRTGVNQVSIMGLRLGATLAQKVAMQRDDVDGICMWEPCLDGKELLDEWTQDQKAHEKALGYTATKEHLSEVLGFSISPELMKDVQELSTSPQQLIAVPCDKKCVAVEDPQYWQQLLGDEVTYISSQGIEIWRQEAMQARVPISLLSSIQSWLIGSER